MNSSQKREMSASLLRTFIDEGRSEAAFTALVSAFGGLVYGSAYRRLQNAALAEDVSQTVFMILANKAERLKNHPSLSAWLFKTTRYEAEKIQRGERRRQQRQENYSRENLDVMNEESSVSSEDVFLLDESIASLSEKDRVLVLERFFERLSFREIAERSNKSEAACKMQLRRVLAKMEKWLSARGCMLSATALTSLLASEFSKAAPEVMVKMVPPILKGAVGVSSSVGGMFPILMIFMKLGKLKLLGLCLLILMVTISTIHYFSSRGEREFNESDRIIRASAKTGERFDIPRDARTAALNRFMHFLETYPYAEDRLEELYGRYPNLRRRLNMSKNGEHPLILLSYDLKNAELYNDEDFLKEAKQMWLGNMEWDEEAVAQYLEKREKLLDRILTVAGSERSAHRWHMRYYEEMTVDVSLVGNILNLKIAHLQRQGLHEEAVKYLNGSLSLAELMEGGRLVTELFGRAIEYESKGVMRRYAMEGGDLSLYEGSLRKGLKTEVFQESLRAEFSTMISLLEALQSDTEMKEIAIEDGVEKMVMGMKGEDEVKELKEAYRRSDFRELQESYAEVFSSFIETLEADFNQGRVMAPDQVEQWFTEAEQSSSDEHILIFENMMGKPELNAVRIVLRSEQWNAEFSALIALQRARGDGVEVSNLEQLVPEYLEQIPFDPGSGEELYLDEDGQLRVPNDIRSKMLVPR